MGVTGFISCHIWLVQLPAPQNPRSKYRCCSIHSVHEELEHRKIPFSNQDYHENWKHSPGRKYCVFGNKNIRMSTSTLLVVLIWLFLIALFRIVMRNHSRVIEMFDSACGPSNLRVARTCQSVPTMPRMQMFERWLAHEAVVEIEAFAAPKPWANYFLLGQLLI